MYMYGSFPNIIVPVTKAVNYNYYVIIKPKHYYSSEHKVKAFADDLPIIAADFTDHLSKLDTCCSDFGAILYHTKVLNCYSCIVKQVAMKAQ